MPKGVSGRPVTAALNELNFLLLLVGFNRFFKLQRKH